MFPAICTNTVPFLVRHIAFLNFIPIRKHPWTLIVFLQASRAQPTMKEAWICHRGTQRNEGTWDKLPRDARDKTVVGRSTVGVEWVVTERNWKAEWTKINRFGQIMPTKKYILYNLICLFEEGWSQLSNTWHQFLGRHVGHHQEGDKKNNLPCVKAKTQPVGEVLPPYHFKRAFHHKYDFHKHTLCAYI